MPFAYEDKSAEGRHRGLRGMNVTFVVPTIGRPTLGRALESLYRQTNQRWDAVVQFDGGPAYVDHPLDDKISLLGRDYSVGSAGLTRNDAIRHNLVHDEAFHHDWFAFLDDDDAIHPRYVEWLYDAEYLDPAPDCVVFRMAYENGTVLPSRVAPTIAWGQVGISFAVRKRLFDPDPCGGVWFRREDLSNPGPAGNEDINLLLQLHDHGARVHIHDEVAYYVRHDPNEEAQ